MTRVFLFVDNEKQKVKEGLCLLGISLVSSWGWSLKPLSVFHYPQGMFLPLRRRKALISRAGQCRQDITVPYLPAEQPALPAGYETLSDTDRNSLQREMGGVLPHHCGGLTIRHHPHESETLLLVHSEECSEQIMKFYSRPSERPGLGRGTFILMDALPCSLEVPGRETFPVVCITT